MLLFIIIDLFPDYDTTGPFQNVSYRVLNIPGIYETMSNSRVYYPSSGTGVDTNAVPCPIIVFGHGFQMGIDRYYSYAKHLASWGYVVVLPTISNPFPTPEHYTRARSMVDAALFISSLNDSVNDLFYHKLDKFNWGFAGHSMGGGLALLAADTFKLPDTLKAVVSLASPQTTPQTHSEHLDVPKMIIAGSVDNIAPWNDVRSAYWTNAPEPGTFAVINGANHGFFMDYSYFWENGGTATITREEQQRISRRHMTAFFNRYLKNESTDWNFHYCFGDSIYGHPTMDTVEVRYTGTGIYEERNLPSTIIGKTFKLEEEPNSYILIFDITGKLVKFLKTPTTWEPKKEGIYFIKTKSKIIKIICIK